MKTKILFAFICIGLFVYPAFGQKQKSKNIAIKYVSLPSEKLPDDFQTYSVKVYGSAISQSGLNAANLARRINMSSFKRLDGDGQNYGHLRVTAYSSYVRSRDLKSRSEKKTKKDKDGKVTDSWTEYWYDITLYNSGNFKIVDPEGNYLSEGTHSPSKQLSTSKRRSRSQAREAYENELGGMKQNFAKNSVNALIDKVRNTLQNKFDFSQRTANEILYLIKKHDSEDGFESGFDTAKSFFKEAQGDVQTDAIKAKLGKAMEFYKKVGEKKPSSSDKKGKKVFQAANYNYALLSYYTDDLDAAEKHAKMVKTLMEKDRRADDLIKRVQMAKERMALHGVTTMHYVRDVSAAKAPAKVKALEEEKEELEEENNTSNGSITKNGEKIEGAFAQDKTAADLAFGPKGNTKFMVSGDDGMKEIDLTSDDISSFSIGERKFVKMNFAPCAKGKGDLKKHILEEVYVSQKIRLYKYYPSAGALGDEKVEFAYLKGTEENPTSLMDTQFLLFNKGMSKYFEDCADLKTMAAEGGFKMEKDDLIKAARIYSELCE